MFVESGIKYYSSLYHFPLPFFQMHTKFRRVYETTVILNGDHHNHSLASPAVTTTIAVIHEKEEEEEEEEEKATHILIWQQKQNRSNDHSVDHMSKKKMTQLTVKCSVTHYIFQRSDERPLQCMSRSPSMLLS